MSALWLVPILIWPSRSKLISGAIGLILWAGSMVGLGYWLIYGQDFSQSVLFIMFESNPAESSEFISSYFRWWHPIVFGVYSIIPILIWQKIHPIELSKRRRHAIATIFVLLISWPLINYTLIKKLSLQTGSDHLVTRMEPATPWNLVLGYTKYLSQLSAMQGNLEINRNAPPLEGFSEKNSQQAKTVVLVIGESTNSGKMSLYGYQRKTSPELEKLHDELFVFKNVIAPRPYTIEALQQVLSFDDEKSMGSKGVADFFKQTSLLNMMKQADYEITWITNQQTQTKRNTMLTSLSQLADNQIYLNNNRAQNSNQYDEVVLAPFAKALSSPAQKKLIVVHLLGTHRKYNYRFPDKFAKFTTKKGVHPWVTDKALDEYNSYDNAVLYNDHVVSELIRTLASTENQKLLVYFSDHGEEVYDSPDNLFTGRNEGKPTPAMYTVPFVVWASPEYLATKTTTHWRDYLERPYSTYDFIYTWADMVDIDFKRNDHSRSLVSDEFIARPRWIGDPTNPKSLRNYAEITADSLG